MGNVLTEIWPTLDEGGKKFEIREILGSELRRIFHLDTRSARGCTSPFRLRLPSRNNSGNTPWQRGIFLPRACNIRVWIYAHT